MHEHTQLSVLHKDIRTKLLSGKKVMEMKDNGEVVMLWKEIKGILEVEDQRKERLSRWMDPKLKGCFDIDDVLSLANLARACTSERSSDRPRMAEIVFNLCVLTQSSPQMYEKSWNSNLEAMAFTLIGKEESLKGYWKENLPQVIRVIPYSAVQLFAYETYKQPHVLPWCSAFF